VRENIGQSSQWGDDRNLDGAADGQAGPSNRPLDGQFHRTMQVLSLLTIGASAQRLSVDLEALKMEIPYNTSPSYTEIRFK